MKFNHKFKLSEKGESFALYKSENINARLDFVSNTALRVAIFKDGEAMLPTFNVCPEENHSVYGRNRLDVSGFALSKPTFAEDGNTDIFTFENGITVKLCKDNFLLSYYNEKELLFCDRAPLGYNFENEFGKESFHYVSREIGEKIYGLGDKGGKLNKYGNAYRIETTDCMGYDASSTDPLYKHIPFYICENSVGSYGIFYDTSDTSYIDLGKEVNNYYEPYKFFKTEDNCLIYYVFFGSKLSVLKQFSALTGKQAFPPKWSFDYNASTMAYTDAPDSEKKMYEFLDKLHEIGLSCTGFYMSSGYTSIGNQRCVFHWNKEKFPNAEKFVEDFSNNGVELIPNIKPAFLQSHPMYKEIEQNGWFVKNPDGSPFVTQFWDGLGSYLDFTNPGAFDFWQTQVTQKLLDLGIKATWNDNNEFDIKDSEALSVGFGDGEVKASRIRPVLTHLMVESSYRAQREKYPELRPFLSTRSGGVGLRRLAQTWSGDNRTHFPDLRYCHYIGLTMSMSGLYFYGHDLGGFSGDMPSRELLLRWIQHGLFEPRFTIHSWNKDGSATMPWSYDDIIPSVKEIFSQRKVLKPYLYNCAFEAVEKDLPINAPLFLYYDDENIPEDTNSFMLGRDILVTLVFDEGEEKVNAYLPCGDDWYMGEKLYKGGQTVELSIPATSKVPYFKRSGSVIASDEGDYGFKSQEKLVFTVYPKESGTFESEFFTDDGESFEFKNGNCVMLKFTVTCTEDEVIVEWKNDGKTEITPDIRLCSADKRRLVVK